MKILPPVIASSKLNCLLQIQGKSDFLPPLSLGEEVVAKVMENSHSGKTQILLKNLRVLADSNLQLRKGENITVRVAQVHPKVILHLVQNKIPENFKVMESLRFYRSNPKALFEFFKEGIDRISLKNLGELATNLGEKDVKEIQTLLKSLIFSKESLKNPFFFRDYIHKFGYLMENGLGEALKRKSDRAVNVKNASQNLKGCLLNLSDRLHSVMETRNLPGAGKLAGFISSSLEIIESHQVINHQFQENDGKYMFHIPLLFQEKMGLAEIFVNFRDQHAKDRNSKGEKSVVFLLNMDVLGEIVVEAKVKTKKIGCILKCDDKKAGDFIRPFLGELGEKLMALGYGIDGMKCVTEKDHLNAIRDHEFQSLFALENIDVIA